MTPRIEKTVFISYRRTNLPWALCIYQNLTMHGYDVFFDYLSIDSGNFEKVIIENIKTRAHFIVILTPSALERCNEPGDWLRREIETAMDEKRNIVPLMLESFDFGSTSVVKALTGKLATLNQYNGLRVPSEYFLEAMGRLRDRYLNIAISDIALPSLNTEAQEITESQQTAASEAAPVENEQLTAQEWFERGYVFSNNDNFDEAVRCFSEAILLKSDFAEAYVRRGIAYGSLKKAHLAIEDFTRASELNPEDNYAYAGRGLAYHDQGDFGNALTDLNHAIQLKPDSAMLYVFRSLARQRQNDLDGAYKDIDEAIRIEPNYALAYFYRALAKESKKDAKGALADYNEAIRLNQNYISAYYNRAEIWENKKSYSSAIADYKKYLELGGGERDSDQKEVEEKIKNLKELLKKKRSSKRKK